MERASPSLQVFHPPFLFLTFESRIMKLILSIIALSVTLNLSGQTASNWTATDCSGGNHELFADLDAGKAVVIIWVMPCANCIDEALTAQKEVQDALALNAGKVVFYLADDYGNTTCSTLQGWASQNGITDAIIVNSKNVSMTPYGAAGMPKTVVAGGGEHKIFYNENAPNITAAGIKAAIASAMAAPTGLDEKNSQGWSASVFPNPSGNSARLLIVSQKNTDCTIEVLNVLGERAAGFTHKLASGQNELMIDASVLPDGTYFIVSGNGQFKTRQKLIVNH
jgi:hypothetical protein